MTDYSEDYQFGERDYLGKFSKACGIDISNMSEFYYCFEYLSYTKEEIILGIETRKRVKKNYNIFICLGSFLVNSKKNQTFTIEWDQQNYIMRWGKCLTAKNLENVNSMSLHLLLNPNFTYNIWISDPKFQVLSSNPSSIPGIKKTTFKESFLQKFHL